MRWDTVRNFRNVAARSAGDDPGLAGSCSSPGNSEVSDAGVDGRGPWSEAELVSATAHQLRGPLTVMRGILETLRGRPDLDSGTRDHLVDQALAAAGRQEALITTLLDDQGRGAERNGGPRPVAGKRFVAEDVELLSAVERVVRESLTPEDQERVRLRVPEQVRVSIDPVALDCVVSNLIANAIGYSPAATRVEVSVETNAVVGADEVRVVVADAGPGIDPEDRERIFEPYERSSRVAGVGLGLAIARWAVEASGGRIWAEGEAGEGARFCFTLPAASHRSSGEERGSTGASRGARPPHMGLPPAVIGP